jgi:REP element-mobilizing transposase RayT
MTDPLAYFITWTVYGSRLQGDARGWRKNGVQRLPEPYLEAWHKQRLKHPVIKLSREMRPIVENEFHRLANHYDWKIWECAARSNHCHIAVTATGLAGDVVRDRFKANATRVLREHFPIFRSRDVWTAKGDWDCINTEEELEAVCQYIRECQDLMHLPKY